MSAFMFVFSDKSVKETSTKELEELLIEQQALVDGVDWDKFQMCNFKYDQASGARANVYKITQELEQRMKGVSEPLDRVLVPGYNPAIKTGDTPE